MVTISRALDAFKGVGRRCEDHGEVAIDNRVVAIVDDYGHHPRELAATFEAVRAAYPGRRLLVAFQPHRYSRTRDLFDDFCEVLANTDALVLTEVYAAGEEPIIGADARALARGIRARGRVEPVVVGSVAALPGAIEGIAQDQDVLLTLGAGDIGGAAALLVATFGRPAAVSSVGVAG